ncbi:hypothetical protein TSAR_014639 [Trichomalopsis sarcophagae]|uniref:Uncharacterized protein n=1 Tax=Trichomalopsis sarcophagae TaxID=543379 RepID=A0A232EGS1_9HYME|nr:hypothetical protein TSAR_014639 [Trichomalopsis sarcophagae]
MISQNIALCFFAIVLFASIVNADVDDDYHQLDVKWVDNVIEKEANDLIKECRVKAAEFCADTAGSWGDAVNCVRTFRKYGGHCEDLDLANHKLEDYYNDEEDSENTSESDAEE